VSPLEILLAVVAVVGFAFGVNGWLLARRWQTDCSKCRIIIGRKGKVVLDAPLTEWLSWNKALPKREQSRGGIVFNANGIQVALARPKIGPPTATTEHRKVSDAEGAAKQAGRGGGRVELVKPA
jgi:hypothetical protein